jgi:hypothetical protein
VCGTRIVVCVSQFGSLALVCADKPGAFLGTDDAQAEGELDAADLRFTPRVIWGHDQVHAQVVPYEDDGAAELCGRG